MHTYTKYTQNKYISQASIWRIGSDSAEIKFSVASDACKTMNEIQN